MGSIQDQVRQLEAAIAAQETLRPTLGDDVVEAALAALRGQLATLQARAAVGAPRGALTRPASPFTLPPGERKQVTVLFSDLSGFTALSERLDPELIQTFLNDVFEELAGVVYQYEGFVDKYIGDAIMAVFGAPITHEDDPERALRAALAMRQRMHALNERWADRLGGAVRLHIGVNTGPVVTGEIGATRGRSYSVTGDTVNVTARLQDAAPPGQIFVSLSTYRLTHEAFSFRALDPIRVKGKREPLVAFELERARLEPGKSRGLQGLSAALVGRESELRQLLDVVDDLAAGRGRVVTIAGEAGIGKSRLLAEWRAAIGDRARWGEGRSYPHTSALAYGPFVDMLHRYAGIRDEDTEAQARALFLEAMERLFPGDPEARAILASMMGLHLAPDEAAILGATPAAALRGRIFSLVEAGFERAARQQPTLLVLEDLHWADQTSVDLAEHLLPLTERVPLAIVGLFRRDPDAPSQRFLAAAESRYADRHLHLALQPLESAASLALVEQLLATSDLPASLRTLITEKAEGNPFFVEELIRALIGRGALVQAASGQGWVATPLIESVTVPDTLQGVLMSRLDRLPDETKWVVQQAAVIGRVFLYRVLRQMAERSDGLEADLSHLERDELIRQRAHDPEVEYIFQHALTQETAYESLLASRRRELHRKVGEAMVALFADRLSEFVGIVAEHFLRGEVWDRAFAYFLQAGDAATRLHAAAEARVNYAKALEALAHLPPIDEHRRHQVDTTVKLVSVSFGAESPERNLALLAQAEQIVKDLTPEGPTPDADRLRLARIRNWMGRSHMYANQMPQAIGYYQQVLADAQELGDDELLVIPSSVIGRVMMAQGRFAEGGQLVARAIAPLERAASWQEWIITVGYHGISLAARGHYAAGLKEAECALARAREINHFTAISVARILLTVVEFFGGDPDRLIAASRACVEAGARSGDPMYVYAAYGFWAWAESRLGHPDTAADLAARSLEAGSSLGGRLILVDWFAARDAEMALAVGRPEEAVQRAQQVIAAAAPGQSVFARGLAHRFWGLGLAQLDPPRWLDADAQLAESLAVLTSGDAQLEAARTHVAWAETLFARGDRPAALDHLVLAASQFETSGLAEELARTNRAIAELSPLL